MPILTGSGRLTCATTSTPPEVNVWLSRVYSEQSQVSARGDLKCKPGECPEMQLWEVLAHQEQSNTTPLRILTMHTTSVPDSDLLDPTRWVPSHDLAWAEPLDSEERSEMLTELALELSVASLTCNWQRYQRSLRVWVTRAELARMYSTPLTRDQEAERDAWRMIQDDAIAAVFDEGADS